MFGFGLCLQCSKSGMQPIHKKRERQKKRERDDTRAESFIQSSWSQVSSSSCVSAIHLLRLATPPEVFKVVCSWLVYRIARRLAWRLLFAACVLSWFVLVYCRISCRGPCNLPTTWSATTCGSCAGCSCWLSFRHRRCLLDWVVVIRVCCGMIRKQITWSQWFHPHASLQTI